MLEKVKGAPERSIFQMPDVFCELSRVDAASDIVIILGQIKWAKTFHLL